MAIALLRAGLRHWLSSQTRVDIWDLDLPANVPTVVESGTPPLKKRYPANSAVEMPVSDLKMAREGFQVEAAGKFTYLILYRFSGKASKEQLPIKAVETLIESLIGQAILYPQDVWEGVRSLSADISEPVTLGRMEGEDGDWLIIARIELQIRFVSIPEVGSTLQPPILDVDMPIPVQQLKLGIYRSLHPVQPDAPATHTQDAEIDLDFNL
jgi:hypothetical protein